MSKINYLLIVILILLVGVVLFLRRSEAMEYQEKINNLEELQRLNYIEIDSLITGNLNLEEYIKELEDSVEYLEIISNKRGFRLEKYKRLLNEKDEVYFSNIDDSTLIELFSGVRLDP